MTCESLLRSVLRSWNTTTCSAQSVSLHPRDNDDCARRATAATAEPSASTPETPLNPDQDAAVEAIRAAAGTFAAFLLQGVTGSGKTDVFLAAADTAIAQGGQVLLLVPEINLTPQLE